MAQFFSDHYAPRSSATVAPASELPRVRVKVPSGIHRTPVQASRAYFDFSGATTFPAVNDLLRLMTFQSSDRLWELHAFGEATTVGAWTGNFSGNVGLYKSGVAHDGITVSPNFFANAVDFTVDRFKSDMFSASGSLSAAQRGRQMWELVSNQGLPVMTEDPQIQYDLVVQVTTSAVTAGGIISIEALFSPAGK